MKLQCTSVFVSDMRRSVEFYRDVLGLAVRFETTHWTEFETGSATLALHRAESASTTGAEAEAAGRVGRACGSMISMHCTSGSRVWASCAWRSLALCSVHGWRGTSTPTGFRSRSLRACERCVAVAERAVGSRVHTPLADIGRVAPDRWERDHVFGRLWGTTRTPTDSRRGVRTRRRGDR